MAFISTGIDCSTVLNATTAKLFASDGNNFAGRYYPSGLDKSLTRYEAEVTTAAGLQILSIFERTSGRAKLGTAGGIEDGALAFQSARDAGQPRWLRKSISFTVDFDAQIAEYPTIAEYFIAAGKQIPGYLLYAYAKRDLMEYLLNRKIIKGGWQPAAWGGSEPSPLANIWQHTIDQIDHGIEVDWNDSYGNEGWWNTNEVEPFDDATANKVVADLSALYNASSDIQVQAASHYAAEALRGHPLPIISFDSVAIDKVIAALSALYNASADTQVQAASHAAADILRDTL